MNRRHFLSFLAGLPVVGKYWKPNRVLATVSSKGATTVNLAMRLPPTLIVAPKYWQGRDAMQRIYRSIYGAKYRISDDMVSAPDGRTWRLICDGSRVRGYHRDAHVYLLDEWRNTPNIHVVLHRGFKNIEELHL